MAIRCRPRERPLRIASSGGNTPRCCNVVRHASFRDTMAVVVPRTVRRAGGSSTKTVSRVPSRRQLRLLGGSCESHVRATRSTAASASVPVGAPELARRSLATARRSRHPTSRKDCRPFCTMQRGTWGRGKIISTASGKPRQPIDTGPEALGAPLVAGDPDRPLTSMGLLRSHCPRGLRVLLPQLWGRPAPPSPLWF